MSSNLITETAGNIITDALFLIKALPAEIEIPQYEGEAGLFYLNSMMSDLSIVGINLGYTRLTSLGEQVTIDPSAYDPIVNLLAIEIAPVFSKKINPNLFEQAQESREILLQISFTTVGFAQYPSTFPKGSGNDNYGNWVDDFYNVSNDQILTEGKGNISPERPIDDDA